MAVDVFRFTHPGLLNALFFKDEEVSELRVNPFQRVEEQISQSGNVSLVHVGSCYFIFTVVFNMFYRDTVEKLDQMRDAQAAGGGNDEFRFWPFWLYDQNTNFTVLWTNVADFHERHVHGRIAGCWEQPVVLKEVVVGVCTVPS